MATFSRRLFETLGDLDQYSQLIVVVNNLRGITEQERDIYRALALNNDQRLVTLVNAFKVDRNTEQLIRGMRSISESAPTPATYYSNVPPYQESASPSTKPKYMDKLYNGALKNMVIDEVQKLNKQDSVNYLAKYFARAIADNQAYNDIMPVTLAKAAANQLFKDQQEEKTKEEIKEWAQNQGVFQLPEIPNEKFMQALKNLQSGSQRARSQKSRGSKRSSNSNGSGKSYSKNDMFKLRNIAGLGQINAKQLVGQMRKYLVQDAKIEKDDFIRIMSNIGTKVTGWAKMRQEDALSSLFNIIDVNQDNVIDRNELSNSLLLLAGGRPEDKIEAMFMLYDINGDGLISFDELYQHQLCVFQILFQTDPKAKRKVGETAENMAQITTESIFQQIDTNNDKVITLEEFQVWYCKTELGQDISEIKKEKIRIFNEKKQQIYRIMKTINNSMFNNKELERVVALGRKCGFYGIHVFDAQKIFTEQNNTGFVTRLQFMQILKELIIKYGENPQVETPEFNEFALYLFSSFDHLRNDLINMEELFCGLSIACRGNLAEKMHAVFDVFDVMESEGVKLLNAEELTVFFDGTFTILMQGVILPQGVTVDQLTKCIIKEIYNKFEKDIEDEDEGITYEEIMKWITMVSN